MIARRQRRSLLSISAALLSGALLTVAVAGLAPSSAFAQSTPSLDDATSGVDGKSLDGLATPDAGAATGGMGDALSQDVLMDKLAGQGFSDVKDLSRDGDVFNAVGTDAGGQAMDLKIDALSGDVLSASPL